MFFLPLIPFRAHSPPPPNLSKTHIFAPPPKKKYTSLINSECCPTQLINSFFNFIEPFIYPLISHQCNYDVPQLDNRTPGQGAGAL